MPYMVKCELDKKKHIREDMMIEMKPADYYLKLSREYVIDIVWFNKVIEIIR